MTLPVCFRWPAIVTAGVWGMLGCGETARDRLPTDDPGSADGDLAAGLTDDPCPGPALTELAGTAQRSNDNGYPDSIAVAVTWTLVETDGCVDTYAPSGTATYEHLIPGALCLQSIEPANAVIAPEDGGLVVDRATVPPTWSGAGATYWTVTHTCVSDTEPPITRTFTGGATWLDGTGPVLDGQIAGAYSVDDPDRCGPEGIAPCTYAWSFSASM